VLILEVPFLTVYTLGKACAYEADEPFKQIREVRIL